MARANASSPSSPWIGFAIGVGVLYFARDLLIPFAFALLLAFLLSPIVQRMEGWKIPRVPAALAVVAVTAAFVAMVGWLVASQIFQIAQSLPQYSKNVRDKIEAMQGESSGVRALIASFEEMNKEMNVARPGAGSAAPMPVEVVAPGNILQTVWSYAGGILKPLGMGVFVLVLTIFMLIDRENGRNRLLRLMGQQKLQATTKAMDDAGQRVSRYVLMQSLVNAGFGSTIAVGLWAIGVPSWQLWGILGVFLRFLPYVGPVIAGSLPFVLTIAVTDSWRTPLSVVALFSVTELIIANFLEPLLYGVHTGLSAVAILVSAVFWTVLWGPVGLVLATPLTVCLSAVGRHSPQLEFLNVVLGDEPVLSPDVIFYQRLLALDQQDALNVLETLGKDKPLIAVFDEIVVPALAMAERDRHVGHLDSKREDFIVQSINELVTELTEGDSIPLAERPSRTTRVFLLPAHDAADEIAAAMCAHFLIRKGFPAIAFPMNDSPGGIMSALGVQPDDIVCISAVPPFAASNTGKIARNLQENGVAPLILAGLWTSDPPGAARAERLKKTLGAQVATSLADAVAQVEAFEAGRTVAPAASQPA